ncbi:uncharacterized protein LOC129795246 [Lutzomyia longipalpis]|uniref:uncharacterized protein LOC129795246 n=1 Tax=Lutzomyia longipalpis TaxID=7200 RepID=UPI002483B2C2|nr:uncharacterized protein LOC129795246 [Lutzomyia longipalpis]
MPQWRLIASVLVLFTCLPDISAKRSRNRNYLLPSPFSNVMDGRRTTMEYAKNIHFKYYDSDNQLVSIANLLMEEASGFSMCNPDEKFAIIVHGWKESCETEWVPWMISNLTVFRGGCIICMDYGGYASADRYLRLFRQFDPITEILAGKLRLMEAMGFNLGQGFIFGFSYGGHVAVEASKRVGVRRLEAIDICDIAGPAFDFRRAHIDHRNAARNVQCIHTSRDKGSRHTTTCHQNWKMGTCGWFQTAAADPPKGSHGLCPYFYLSAFSNDFLAVPKPMGCMARKPARYWPEGFRMGYREPRKWQVQGELFALTTKEYPFTSNATEMNALDFFPMLASETEHTEMDIDFFVETTKKP